MTAPGFFSWAGQPPPATNVGTLRIAGTIGHCIGADGKRMVVPAVVQEMMNRAARRISREIRDTN